MAITAPDVAPQSIPGFREQSAANETTFGGGPGLAQEGQELQKITTETGDIAAFEKIRADQTAVEAAQAQASRLTTDVLYDPKTGVLGSRGTDALQAQKDGMARLQKGMNDISQGLNGEQQIGAFNKWAQEHVAASNTTIMGHVDKELKEHDATSFDDLLKNQQGLVALGHANSQTLAVGFKTVNDNAVAFAARNRLDPDQTKQFVQDANDKMHTAVIDGMTKFQNDDSAQKYFDANKDNISPAAQEKIVTALQEHGIRWKASNLAQGIMQNNSESEADALKATEKISNPEVQDAARKLISARFSENRAAIKNDQDDTFMKMNTMVNQKGLTDPIDRRMAVPPMAWNKLSSEQQRAIEKGGQTDVTSPKKWLDFMEQVKNGGVTDMSRADLQSKYLPYFDTADSKRAEDMWSGSKGKGNQRLMDDQNMQKIIDTSLVENGFIHADPKMRHATDNDFAYRFGDAVHRDYLSTEASLKRTPKPEEVQAIVDRQTIKALGSRPTPFMSKIFGSAPPVDYEQIPDQAKEDLMAFSRSQGKPVTKEQVERAYPFYQKKDLSGVKKALGG